MEEIKYFVPQIEDIRVGYECEFQKGHNEGTPIWEWTKIEDSGELCSWTTDLGEMHLM